MRDMKVDVNDQIRRVEVCKKGTGGPKKLTKRKVRSAPGTNKKGHIEVPTVSAFRTHNKTKMVSKGLGGGGKIK